MEPIDMAPLTGERVAEALAGLAERNGRSVLEVIRLSLVAGQLPKRQASSVKLDERGIHVPGRVSPGTS